MTQAQFRALTIGTKVYSPIAPTTALVVHNAYYRKMDGRFVFFVAFDSDGRATVSQDETLVADLQTKPITHTVRTWEMPFPIPQRANSWQIETSGFQSLPMRYADSMQLRGEPGN